MIKESMNKIKLAILPLTVSVALLSGCATTGGAYKEPLPVATKEMKQDARRDAVKAGAKGCGIGAAAALVTGLIGGGVNIQGAIAACAVAGGTTGVVTYAASVKAARQAEAAAQAAGWKARVDVGPVEPVKANTPAKPAEEALQSMTIDYDAKDFQPVTPKTKEFLDAMASMLLKSNKPLTIKFEGVSGCTAPITELQKRGALAKHTVIDACGKGPSRITVTPVPNVGV